MKDIRAKRGDHHTTNRAKLAGSSKNLSKAANSKLKPPQADDGFSDMLPFMNPKAHTRRND